MALFRVLGFGVLVWGSGASGSMGQWITEGLGFIGFRV